MGRDACVSALADLQLDDHDDPALRRRAVLARRARGEGRHDRRALPPSGERHGRERSLFVGARTSGPRFATLSFHRISVCLAVLDGKAFSVLTISLSNAVEQPAVR